MYLKTTMDRWYFNNLINNKKLNRIKSSNCDDFCTFNNNNLLLTNNMKKDCCLLNNLINNLIMKLIDVLCLIKLKKQINLMSILLIYLLLIIKNVNCYENELNKSENFLMDKINLEQSIAAVFNKVAYGSTTKRSIPDNIYPITTLATPLLTTYRYSDGNEEWYRVDLKKNPSQSTIDNNGDSGDEENPKQINFDLEKDHVLPTSAPAADILKNNNNNQYKNPNRYNNDRLRPDFNEQQQQQQQQQESVTENYYKTTTNYNLLKNIRPTKSMYSKDLPSYVPPSRAFFTPPLPPEYQNPFADKPTLRGTNSDGFASRRPIPPPSLMPNKDRIPFRPDLPSTVTNTHKVNLEKSTTTTTGNNTNPNSPNSSSGGDKKKTLNTPSQTIRLSEIYNLNNKNDSHTNFEYEKSYAPEPSITRILSGSNGRHDDIHIPDILFRAVTALTPTVQKNPKHDLIDEIGPKNSDNSQQFDETSNPNETNQQIDETVTIKKKEIVEDQKIDEEIVATTQFTQDLLNLPNIKEKGTTTDSNNITMKQTNSEEIWFIFWNVHVYLVVFAYILLAIYSIIKLIRYENDPHMFSKSYFLTIHLMLTVICVLRIFYLTYDPYNIDKSFNVFLFDFLHSFPLSLLATTFSILILFLLKRTLIHLEIKNRPIFLVIFSILHIIICFIVSLIELFGHLNKTNLVICKPIFVLLTWSLGASYLYLYHIIKNVITKKSQNLSELCTQNISYASHITIAIALLFILLGFVQFYSLIWIPIDNFNGTDKKYHWVLWGCELSVRFLEITIIILLAIVVSLKMSQREKHTSSNHHHCTGNGGGNTSGGGGFPLFPCTTSDSSTDNIYPNNCNTNPNAINYSRNNDLMMDNLTTTLPPSTEQQSNNLFKQSNSQHFNENSFKFPPTTTTTTLERVAANDSIVSAFERGNGSTNKWNCSERDLNNFFTNPNELLNHDNRGGSSSLRNSARKNYDNTSTNSSKYYTKPKYDEYQPSTRHNFSGGGNNNIYSEPIDQSYNQQSQQQRGGGIPFERSDFERRSRNSSINTATSSSSSSAGRSRSSTGRTGRKTTVHQQQQQPRSHLGGIQTLPSSNHHHFNDNNTATSTTSSSSSMLVDEQGFVRFRHMQDELLNDTNKNLSIKTKSNHKKQLLNNDLNHFSDA